MFDTRLEVQVGVVVDGHQTVGSPVCKDGTLQEAPVGVWRGIQIPHGSRWGHEFGGKQPAKHTIGKNHHIVRTGVTVFHRAISAGQDISIVINAAHSTCGGTVAPQDTVGYLIHIAGPNARTTGNGLIVHDGIVLQKRIGGRIVNSTANISSIIGYQAVRQSRIIAVGIVDIDSPAILGRTVVGEFAVHDHSIRGVHAATAIVIVVPIGPIASEATVLNDRGRRIYTTATGCRVVDNLAVI